MTGASSGIGLAVARLLAAAGAHVHAVARRQAEGDFTSHCLDVRDRAAVEELVAGIGRSQPIDILICSAGTNLPQRRLDQLTGEAWEELLAVNLSGAFYFLRAALPHLRSARGDVILVSSVSALWPDQSGSGYQAAKAGLLALGRAAALEEHRNGVRVTTILPGLVNTPILDRRPSPPPARLRPLMLQPDDVASACLFALTLPEHAFVPELTIMPTALQTLGTTSAPLPQT